MGSFHLWDPSYNEDYALIDDMVSEQFEISGLGIIIHKYLGIQYKGNTHDLTQPNVQHHQELGIQDFLLLENRDLYWDKNTYEIYGHYSISTPNFSLSQFGALLDFEVDRISIDFSQTTCFKTIGRRLMPGDILELRNLREDLFLNGQEASNKYYMIDEVVRPDIGYSPLWYPHIIRASCKPLVDSQETKNFLDQIHEQSDKTIRDLISTLSLEQQITDLVVEEAKQDVKTRNFDISHFYIKPEERDGILYHTIWFGDQKPPNDSRKAPAGKTFPINPKDGDYFLHIGYELPRLYERKNNTWYLLEISYQNQEWLPAGRTLTTYINNDKINQIGDDLVREKTNIKIALKPKADLDE